MDATMNVVTLYPRLIDGDIGVLSVFDEKAKVDSPLGGHQQPPEFVAEARQWLEAHAARVEDVATTVTSGAVIHEFVLCVRVDGEDRELPVMAIADISEERIRDLRIYHSTWPLSGSHLVRTPLMQYLDDTRPPEPVGTYHAALAAADAVAADAVFEPGGFVREPSGGEFTHAGADRLRWYKSILSDGPLPLRLGNVFDDGDTVVYEYEVEQWGSQRLTPQAGAAAYKRGAQGGLVAARIYDDVTPPSTLRV